MIHDFFSMNGYGLFVWLSFAITFFVCLAFYIKTYKTLKKYEKDFAKELFLLSKDQRKTVLKNSKVATQVLASYNKSI